MAISLSRANSACVASSLEATGPPADGREATVVGGTTGGGESAGFVGAADAEDPADAEADTPMGPSSTARDPASCGGVPSVAGAALSGGPALSGSGGGCGEVDAEAMRSRAPSSGATEADVDTVASSRSPFSHVLYWSQVGLSWASAEGPAQRSAGQSIIPASKNMPMHALA